MIDTSSMEGREGPRGVAACGKGPTMGSDAGLVTFGSALGADTKRYEHWPLGGSIWNSSKYLSLCLNLNFSLVHPRPSLLRPCLVVQLVRLPEQLPAEAPENQEVSELIMAYNSSRP